MQNTNEQQKFLTMFNVQHSQINHQEFQQLADLLLKYPLVYAKSKFDVKKIHSALHLPLKSDAFEQKTRASTVPIPSQGKVNSLLDILD